VDLAPEEAPGRAVASQEQAPASGTILLVEDADGIRRLAAEVIRRAGYHVIEAADPMTALEAASSHRGEIDLLLTDIVMPGGNGVELARRLTAARRLTVLFMSGYTDDAALRNGMLAGDAAFIQKPFTPQELLRKVKQVLEVGV
jgi:CheY-like chemotaxis protein